MTTPTTARDALPNADAWWLSTARAALETLAATGQPFTANDLTELGVTDPDVPARWGSLFAAAKHEGIVRPIGYTASPRRTRSGGVCRIWTGATR